MIRLLLDAHISGRAVGRALREDGHDVYAIDSVKELESMPDHEVLELAASEERVVVTANVRHFLPLVTKRSVQGEPHPGCILVPGSIKHEEFGVIVSGVRAALEDTSQEDWRDRVEWISK